MRATVKVTTNGKVTLPLVLREEMDIDEGDTVEIEVTKTNG